MKKIYFSVLFAFGFFQASAQLKFQITDPYNKPIVGALVMTEKGTTLTESDANGGVRISANDLQITQTQKISIYHKDYLPISYPLAAVPQRVILEKNTVTVLEGVQVQAKRNTKHYVLKAYVRTWEIKNQKLVRFGDGLVDYIVPYKKKSSTLNKVQSYRNFIEKTTDKAPKFDFIDFTSLNSYFQTYIDEYDAIARNNWYTTKKVNDSVVDIYTSYYKDKIGYAVYDAKTKQPSKISVNKLFELDSTETSSFSLMPKIARVSRNFIDKEEWIGTDSVKRPTYRYDSQSYALRNKKEKRYDTYEFVNEIFLDTTMYNVLTPKGNLRIKVDEKYSFYGTDYWSKYVKAHPLPEYIQAELHRSMKELPNKYKAKP